MNAVLRCLFLVAAIALAACAAAPRQPMAREVHGMSDVFAAPGVALAWAILRGADETSTAVVMSLAIDRTAYPWLAVGVRDPFTQARREVLPRMRSPDFTDVRVPRAHFAEFPRTELRLYPSDAAALADTAALVVFFLGVPDTAPEFATEEELRAYLRLRLPSAEEMTRRVTR